MITFKELSYERQWKSTIGLKKNEFLFLSKLFGQTYEKICQVSISEKSANLSKDFTFSTYEDCLFFVLFYLKNPLVYDTLGLLFGINGSLAQKNLERLLPILEETLRDKNLLPRRNFKDLEDFQNFMEKHQDIIIDATETQIQRPKDSEKQKLFYSGKKKKHTVKNLLFSLPNKLILFLGRTSFGKQHDYNLLQKEFPPEINWFEKLKVKLDLGFQGFEKLYQTIKTYIPFKRKRTVKGGNSELTPEQKQYNKSVSKERIKVEHSIGGMKRYRIIVDRIRQKKLELIDAILGICAGLWNLKIIFKSNSLSIT
jgi:hypothetical protein